MDPLEQEFIKELKNLNNTGPVEFHLSAVEAWSLMAAIQLACRHPEFNGPTRQMAEAVARQLQSRLATTPALAEVARRGWDSKFDT